MIASLAAGVVGVALIGAFLGIMLIWVPAPPLIVIVVSVMAMLVYDLVQTVRFGDNYGRRGTKR